MPANEPSGYEMDREDFVQAEEDFLSSESESLTWQLLHAAAQSPQSWAGVIQGANHVMRTRGDSPKAMESFFARLRQKDPGSEWIEIARYIGGNLDSPPQSIIIEMKKVVNQVPPIAFRKLINLGDITWCWEKYGDDPKKLRECLTQI